MARKPLTSPWGHAAAFTLSGPAEHVPSAHMKVHSERCPISPGGTSRQGRLQFRQQRSGWLVHALRKPVRHQTLLLGAVDFLDRASQHPC
jgi:hypothetical protein